MVEYVHADSLPALRQPTLIAAFAGWNDAGESATMAVRIIRRQRRGQQFAHIEPEEFFVFTETRPTVRLTDGATRKIEWPATEFYACVHTDAASDLVLLLGTEPQLRWQTFTAAVMGLAHKLGVQQIITLGSLLADVPHTRPAPISGGSPDPALAARLADLNVRNSNYEGPTGIIGVLNAQSARTGVPAASLWASAPHYLQAQPNPMVALSLLQRLDSLLDLELDLLRLEARAKSFLRQVDEAVGEHPEIRDYVHRLEERTAEGEDAQPSDSGDLPSGEALVEELERFLRRSRSQDEGTQE